jgi:hypothetical protein
VARVWQAATARATQPEHTRRDATLYVDECHDFLNLPGSVADMLAEARVLAHQDLPQLPRDVAARPPSPVVGEATAVRAACNTNEGGQREPSAIETLARNIARRRNQNRGRQGPPAHTGPASGA